MAMDCDTFSVRKKLPPTGDMITKQAALFTSKHLYNEAMMTES